MKQVREFARNIFTSLQPITQQRLTLALLAANIPDLKSKLVQESKVISKLKPYDIAVLLEFCASNYPETKKILTNAEENYYLPLFAQLDELPADERLEVVVALEKIRAFLKNILANLPREELIRTIFIHDEILPQNKILTVSKEKEKIAQLFAEYAVRPNKIFNNPYPLNFFNNEKDHKIPISSYMFEKAALTPLISKNFFSLSSEPSMKLNLLQAQANDLFQGLANEKLFGNEKISYINHIIDNELKYLWNRPTKTAKRDVAPTDNVIDANTIVVMTEVVYKTLGDFYAAKRLIEAIKQRSPNLRVVWLIMEEDKTIPLEELPSDETHLFSVWSELLDSQEVKVVYQAALVVMFPTFHFLSDIQFKNINEMREKKKLRPVVNILEYDYADSSVGSRNALCTGFGEDALGVFLEEPLAESDEVLADTIRSHQGLAGLFSDQTVADYRRTHVCYFGYRNKELHRSRNQLDSGYFIRAVVALQAAKNNTKNIDFVVSLVSEELSKLINADGLEFFRNNGVSAVHVIDSEKSTAVPVPGGNAQGPIVCVYSCFPLPNKVFKAAMQLAERDLIMCTGDQSFSDALVVPGAIPLYQIMAWKQKLYVQFCKTVRKACGDCELTSYAEMVKSSTDPQSVANFVAVHGSQMQQQMLQLQQYLRTHKNLFNNLPQHLIGIVEEVQADVKSKQESTIASDSAANSSYDFSAS